MLLVFCTLIYLFSSLREGQWISSGDAGDLDYLWILIYYVCVISRVEIGCEYVWVVPGVLLVVSLIVLFVHCVFAVIFVVSVLIFVLFVANKGLPVCQSFVCHCVVPVCIVTAYNFFVSIPCVGTIEGFGSTCCYVRVCKYSEIF